MAEKFHDINRSTKMERSAPSHSIARQCVLFSGQGSQYVGMGRAFCVKSAIMEGYFKIANDILNFDLRTLCFDGPIEALTRTNVCQAALYVVGYGAFQALRSAGMLNEISVYGGFSLGEWTALAAASAVSFEDGLVAVVERAKLMSDACEKNPGAMASLIGGDRTNVAKLCNEVGVAISLFNSPQQIVVSGLIGNVMNAIERANEFGIKRAVLLNVAGAYHSNLMADAAEKFKEFVHALHIKKPTIPVLSNTTGQSTDDPAEIRKNIVQQIIMPVQWEDCMSSAWELGAREFYECGAGKVLCGLAKKNLSGAAVFSAEEIASELATADASRM
jgi:[acyl-carrier-protein] S-malonyltransferase